MNVRSPVLSYRHPERSRGIFYVAAVLCTYEVMIKSPRCFGCSSSDALRLIVVQGRFLASLEMTIRGKRYSYFVDFSHREVSGAWALRFYMPVEQPLEEGARQRRRMDPRGGLKTNVKRFISRACHFERSERSLPFAVRDSRFPHMCRALLRFSHLSFIPLEPYPARFARHLPHGGRLTIRDMLFFHLFSCPPGYFCFLPSHSPVFRCARKISRFA